MYCKFALETPKRIPGRKLAFLHLYPAADIRWAAYSKRNVRGRMFSAVALR
jgi:hypothetical protein